MSLWDRIWNRKSKKTDMTKTSQDPIVSNLHKLIYETSRGMLDNKSETPIEIINQIIDFFSDLEESKNTSRIDDFLHMIELRQVHHELVSIIQECVNNCPIPLSKGKGFNRRAAVCLKAIDDFRNQHKITGIKNIILENEVELRKSDGSTYSREEVEKLVNVYKVIGS